jgi:flagellar hook protein FlgE
MNRTGGIAAVAALTMACGGREAPGIASDAEPLLLQDIDLSCGGPVPVIGTAAELDLSLDGPGFFGFTVPDGRLTVSRAMEGRVRGDGTIINRAGEPLLGLGPEGASQQLRVLVVPPTIEDRPTTEILIGVNLSRNTPVRTEPFRAADAEGTSQAILGLELFDVLGRSYAWTLAFTRESPSTWTWHLVAPNEDLRRRPFGGRSAVAEGRLEFDGTGVFVGQTGTEFELALGGLPPQPVRIDFAAQGNRSTAFALDFAVNFLQQDGRPGGDRSAVVVEADGRVRASYANGDSVDAGTVAALVVSDPCRLRVERRFPLRLSLDGAPFSAVAPGSDGTGPIRAGTQEQRPLLP